MTVKKAPAKKTAARKTPAKKAIRNLPVDFSFDEHGLRRGLQYTFLPSGLVDWRSMIPADLVALNRGNFLKKSEPVDVDTLPKEELEILKKKAREEDLIIKLGGYRELAAIRGFLDVRETISATQEFVSVTCDITWGGNFETNMEPVTFSSSADAHFGNCSGDFGTYLTTIASNRAFARAVRNFLRIYIVAQDEISFEKPPEIAASISAGPASALEDKLARSGLSFEEMKAKLDEAEYEFVGSEAWKSPKDIPAQFFPLIFGCIARNG